MKQNGYFANVGNTPLVKISRQLYAKLETYNPTLDENPISATILSDRENM